MSLELIGKLFIFKYVKLPRFWRNFNKSAQIKLHRYKYFPPKFHSAMSSTNISKLTTNGVRSLFSASSDDEEIVVQIVEFEKRKNKNFIIISDGSAMGKAVPQNQEILNPDHDINSIISIRRHMTSTKSVGIIDFDLLFRYQKRIGDPMDLAAIKESEELQSREINAEIDSALIIQSQAPKREKELMATAEKPSSMVPETARKPIEKSSEPVPLSGELKDYESIKTLYVGMPRWTIVCRIVKLEYKEFISKKNGKETKVLSIDLMDRSGMKISGVFFGDAAVQFKDYLVKDRVYKISKGQIREEDYNNTKNDQISKFKLVFTALSSFVEVSDTHSISNNEENAITLGECAQRKILHQEFDIVCVLIKVEETEEIRKEEKLLKKTVVRIADPFLRVSSHIILWNNDKIPSKELEGKAVLLSRFKLNEYKGSLALSGSLRSCIDIVEEHKIKDLTSKTMEEYEGYTKLDEIVQSQNENYVPPCKTIRELEGRLERMREDEWAKSDLDIYINRFNLKKWHYEGCPHCKKAAESMNNCNYCNKYVEKTKHHFIMGLEVSDATGSIWTTAYDEWVRKIFVSEDEQSVAEELLKLDAEEFKEKMENYQYQEYRLRINSKKDSEGRVKHNAGKIYERDEAGETTRNLDAIMSILSL